MKKLLVLGSFLLLCCAVNAQTTNPNYDEALARSLGADDYGMKSYIFVILKTGPNQIADKEKVNDLFKGHLDNINKLANEGKLVVAGPFGKNDRSYRGLFILNAKSFEEANELLKTDPAVKEKLLDVELYNWYGSAALSEYLKAHKKIEKKSF
ncbi:MAG TPA: YciI family protein [Sphingobacteriaceae bacterium]